MKTNRLFNRLLSGILILAGSSLYAADYVPDVIWTGAAGDSLWNTTSMNWQTPASAPVLFAEGQKVLFEAGLDNLTDPETGQVSNYRYAILDTSYQLGGFVFDSDKNYTIAAGADSFGIFGDFQLVKKGSGTLTYFGHDFYAHPLQGTLIQAGTIRVNGPNAVGNSNIEQAFGPKVIFEGGTIDLNSMTDDKKGYENLPWDMEIVDGATATVSVDRNLLMSGSLKGSYNTVFNLNVRYLREHFGGDWSEYEGFINVTSNNTVNDEAKVNIIFCDTLGVGEINPEGQLIAIHRREGFVVDSGKILEGYSFVNRYPLGLPKARIHLNDSARMYWGANTGSSPAVSMYVNNATFRIGALTGSKDAILSGSRMQNSDAIHTWMIGGLNTDEVFEGQFQTGGYRTLNAGTATHIVKVGTGDLRLTNNHSNKGNYVVKEGSMTMLGSASTTGSVIVEAKATLKGNPVFTAAGIADIHGTLEIGDSTLDHSIGKVVFAAADVTFQPGSTLKIGLGHKRNDVLEYYGELNFDPGSTVEFFVEENTVSAGDTFKVLIPANNSANATLVQETYNVVCQEGLVLNTEHLFADPQWAVSDEERDLCGSVIVVSNTAKGKYDYEQEKPVIVSVYPADSSYIGTSGVISINYFKEVLVGSGDITLGGVVVEAKAAGNTLTLTYSGLSPQAESYELIIPAGAVLAEFDRAPCDEFKAFYYQDKIAPELIAQTLNNDDVLSWVDVSKTFTFSEDVKLGNAFIYLSGEGVLHESVSPSVSGNMLTVDLIAMNYAMNYTLNIPQGAVTDLANNPAAAVAVNFTTNPAVVFTDDTEALNGKDPTTLPVLQIPLDDASTNAYPLWVQTASGSTFADGVADYTTVNNSNKVMCAWTGNEDPAQFLKIKVRRTGEGEVALKVQESTGEATPAPWRTMKELTNANLNIETREINFNLHPKARFIKLVPSLVTSGSSIVIEGYQITTGAVAVEPVLRPAIKHYTIGRTLVLTGLESGNRIEVYNLSGIRTASFVAASDCMEINLDGFSLIKVVSNTQGVSVLKAIVR